MNESRLELGFPNFSVPRALRLPQLGRPRLGSRDGTAPDWKFLVHFPAPRPVSWSAILQNTRAHPSRNQPCSVAEKNNCVISRLTDLALCAGVAFSIFLG